MHLVGVSLAPPSFGFTYLPSYPPRRLTPAPTTPQPTGIIFNTSAPTQSPTGIVFNTSEPTKLPTQSPTTTMSPTHSPTALIANTSTPTLAPTPFAGAKAICNLGPAGALSNFQSCGPITACGVQLSQTTNISTAEACAQSCNLLPATCEAATYDTTTLTCLLFTNITQGVTAASNFVTYKDIAQGDQITLANSCSDVVTAFPTTLPTSQPTTQRRRKLVASEKDGTIVSSAGGSTDRLFSPEGYYTRSNPHRYLQAVGGDTPQYQGNCSAGVNQTTLILVYETPDGTSTVGVIGAIGELFAGNTTVNTTTANTTICGANTDVVYTSTENPTPAPTQLPTTPTRRPSKSPSMRPTKFGDTNRPTYSPTSQGQTYAPTISANCTDIIIKPIVKLKKISPGRILKLSYKIHNAGNTQSEHNMLELDLPEGTTLYKAYAFPAVKSYKKAELIDDSTVIWLHSSVPHKKGRTFTFGIKIDACPPTGELVFHMTLWQLLTGKDLSSKHCPHPAPDVKVSKKVISGSVHFCIQYIYAYMPQ